MKKLTVRHPLNKNQDQILKKSHVNDLKNKTKEIVILKDCGQCFLVSCLCFLYGYILHKVSNINCKAYAK